MDIEEIKDSTGKITTKGKMSINSRLNSFRSTWLENLQRHGYRPMTAAKPSAYSSNIKGDTSIDSVKNYSLLSFNIGTGE